LGREFSPPAPLALRAIRRPYTVRHSGVRHFSPRLTRVSAATRKFPETATKLPAGGHENCPLTVMGSARHDVVCLAAFRG
jgi:hypothetical protein